MSLSNRLLLASCGPSPGTSSTHLQGQKGTRKRVPHPRRGLSPEEGAWLAEGAGGSRCCLSSTSLAQRDHSAQPADDSAINTSARALALLFHFGQVRIKSLIKVFFFEIVIIHPEEREGAGAPHSCAERQLYSGLNELERGSLTVVCWFWLCALNGTISLVTFYRSHLSPLCEDRLPTASISYLPAGSRSQPDRKKLDYIQHLVNTNFQFGDMWEGPLPSLTSNKGLAWEPRAGGSWGGLLASPLSQELGITRHHRSLPLLQMELTDTPRNLRATGN